MSAWFERLHPRDPRTGEFIDGDGWASGLADKIGGRFHYRAGTDQRAKVLKDNKSRRLYTRNGYDPGRGDDGMARIAALQGWDAPARTGSSADLDAAVADGGLELWRGVQATSHTPPPAEMLHRERSGPVRYGYGIYGNGMYTSVDRRVADAYGTLSRAGTFDAETGQWGADAVDPTSIQRMVLSPHARVVRYHSAEWRRLTADDTFPEANQLMAAGVDVVYIEGGSQHGGDGTRFDEDQYIILNRTALLYQEPS